MWLIDQRRRRVAARLDVRVPGIVGASVDHPLGTAVHLLDGHRAEAGDGLQRFRRDRHCKVAHEITTPARSDPLKDASRCRLEFRFPVIGDGARAERGKQRAALPHVRLAVLAHHVLPHEDSHQSAWLVGRKDVDPLLMAMDVVAPREQDSVQFGNMRDRCLLSHPGKIRVGIRCKAREIDMEFRCTCHLRDAIRSCAGFNHVWPVDGMLHF